MPKRPEDGKELHRQKMALKRMGREADRIHREAVEAARLRDTFDGHTRTVRSLQRPRPPRMRHAPVARRG